VAENPVQRSAAIGQQIEPTTVVPPPPPPGPGQAWAPTPVPARVVLSPAQRTNPWALASVILGAVSYLGHVLPVAGGVALAIAAIICGFIGLSEIRRTGEGGRGTAIVGISLAVANLILTLLIIVLFLLVIGGSVLDNLLHH